MSKNQYSENCCNQFSADTSIYDDFYIFDLTLGCRYLTFRHSDDNSSVGKSIYDIMTPSNAQELCDHMMSDSPSPMFIQTTKGPALVICSLVQSCSLGILIFSHMGTDNLYRICRKYSLAVRYATELVTDTRYRITKHCLQNEQQLLSLMNTYMQIFSNDMCNRIVTGNLTELLEKQIQNISRFVNCKIHIERNCDTVAYSDFDMGMFTAFVLLVAADALLYSSDGCASLCMEMANRVPVIRFSLNIRGSEILKLPSFYSFRYTAHRKNMPYDYCRTEGMLSGKLIPLSEHLSHLSKHSPQDLTLNTEFESFLHTDIPEIDIDSLLTIEEMLILRERLLANTDTRDI